MPVDTRGRSFGPDRRLRRRPEFQRVYEAGQRLGLRLMTVILAPNGLPQSRLGVSATRKLGGSVVRNRAKRVVREIFRQAELPGGLDIVVIPRPPLLEAPYATVESEFRYALRRASRGSRRVEPNPPADERRKAE
jgi:ribonuclease P protein component